MALILQQRRVRADINGPGRERTSAVHDLGVWGTTFSLIAGTDLTCLACRYISPFPPVYVHPTACDSSCQEKDAIGIRARGRTFKVIVALDPLSRIILLLCAMDGFYIATRSQKKAKRLLQPFRQTQVYQDALFRDEMVLLRHRRSTELYFTEL